MEEKSILLAMGFNFKNLDGGVRGIMVSEIKEALARGSLYYSARFTELGKQKWPDLLIQAAEKADEHWLSYQLEQGSLFKEFEGRFLRSGSYTIAHVPDTKAETFADGEFNRYYMISVCRQAQSRGKNVVVYRAKERAQHRPESEGVVGSSIPPEELLESLRALPGQNSHFLIKPNSGLSLCIED